MKRSFMIHMVVTIECSESEDFGESDAATYIDACVKDGMLADGEVNDTVEEIVAYRLAQ